MQESLLDFYAVAAPDPTGYGEGAIYLGTITTWPQGETPFQATFPVEVPPGYYITATGTRGDLSAGSVLRTSEFSRAIVARPDADGDGVTDSVENGAPHGGDGNGDGVLDSLQSDVVSLPNTRDGEYVVLTTSSGGFRDVQAIPNPSTHSSPPDTLFPIGFFEFTLPTTAATVSVYPLTVHDLQTAYQHGPTAAQSFDHWYQVPNSRVVVQPDHLEIAFFDGTNGGDDDLIENQQIAARIGPAIVLPSAGTTIVVNATDDVDDGVPDGVHTTLREAINLSNYLPGKDRIVFDIPGDGPHTIQPISSTTIDPKTRARVALPAITDTVVIDGYAQPGAAPATDAAPASIMVELDGSLAEWPVNGLVLDADDSIIRGLAVNRFRSHQYGSPGGVQIYILGERNVVEGNYVGVAPDGATAYYEQGQIAYTQSHGVMAFSDENVIGGSDAAARNVISGLSLAGVYSGGERTRILGNFVGTDSTGMQVLGNRTGINLSSKSSQVLIGGTEPGAGNLISGNSEVGIVLASCGGGLWNNRVQGNLIGTDVTGVNALGNGSGIQIISGYQNAIGGSEPNAGNVISGNNGHGIMIMPCEIASLGNTIQGNWIGTNVHGHALGNSGDGIIVGAHRTAIGGVEPGEANLIAHNGGRGVSIVNGIENSILGNRIESNSGLGIDLGGDGVTANDQLDGGSKAEFHVHDLREDFDGTYTTISATVTGPPNTSCELWAHVSGPSTPVIFRWLQTDENGSADLLLNGLRGDWHVEEIVVHAWESLSYANELQNYPELSSAILAGGTTVAGILDSTPDTTFRLEFFSSADVDDSGYGEGATYLGTINVTTASDGRVDFDAGFPTRVPVGHFITATATHPEGNTSEFSEAVAVVPESLDFGDALGSSLPTLLAADGARHVVVPDFHLGNAIDAEADGQPTDSADGDDTSAGDDEDGVRLLTPLVPGQTAAVQVTASAQGRLDAWIDFGNDNSWSDAGDHVFANVTILAGLQTLFVDVPLTAAVSANVPARFRFSSAGNLPFSGLANDGEVEDYLVLISEPSADNLPPDATDDQATTTEDTPVAIDVIANDVDPEGQLAAATVMVSMEPGSGSAFVDRQAGVITYIPEQGFAGRDEFAYRVSDVAGLSDTAFVVIVVQPSNQAPVAEDDETSTKEETPVTIPVLQNDHDPDENLAPGTVRVVENTLYGQLEVDSQSGDVTYIPEADFTGTDRFVYAVSDADGATGMALVKITVTPMSDPPFAEDDTATTLENTSVAIAVLANDFDADGDLDSTSVNVVDPPQHGSTDVDAVTGEISYDPASGFLGIDQFVYRVSDLAGNETTATVWVEVLPTNSARWQAMMTLIRLRIRQFRSTLRRTTLTGTAIWTHSR